MSTHRQANIPPTRQNVRSALSFISAYCDADEWFKILCAIYDALGEDGRDIADWWSQSAPEKYDPLQFAVSWRSAQRPPANGKRKATQATLWRIALDQGWKPSDRSSGPWTHTDRERHQAKVHAQEDKKALKA